MPSLPSSLALTNIPASSEILSADHRNNYSAIQTAVNALITAMSGGTAGQFLTATSSSAVAYAGSYSAYTPTWTSTGTVPAIGNSGVTARYIQIGKHVHCYGNITFGSSATFGTGAYFFALPVTAAPSGVSQIAGLISLYDNSPSSIGLATAQFSDATKFSPVYGATYLGTLTNVGQLAPWTWALNDAVYWNFCYEAA